MNRLDLCSKAVEINSKPLKLLGGLHIIIQGNWTKEPNQIIFQKVQSHNHINYSCFIVGN